MEVVGGAAVVVSRVMVGATFAALLTAARQTPYKAHEPAETTEGIYPWNLPAVPPSQCLLTAAHADTSQKLYNSS